jgi:uncharacterized protein YdiU (UPF0061 family)
MNTDNMAISGETIDYGPCAFMEAYDPSTVFSSIDHAGRYAYGNQPRIAAWNLARLAEALLPLLGPDEKTAIKAATEALGGFAPRFEAVYLPGLRRKAGLLTAQDGDDALIEDLLRGMHEAGADWTLTFRALADAAEGDEAAAVALFGSGGFWEGWAGRWRARLGQEARDPAERAAALRAINPLYIPRNHLVEAALNAAQSGDFEPFEELLGAITRPYEPREGLERFTLPARPEERVLATFCGT